VDSRESAIAWATGIVSRRDVLFLDTETTGLGSQAEIVEIAVVDGAGRTVLHRLVRPSSRSPSEVTEIHGIDDAMVADAPAWPAVFAEFARLLPRYAAIVVYNVSFDRRIINQVNQRHGLPPLEMDWHCAMQQFAAYAGRRHTLERAARSLGVPMSRAHRALADTQVCRGLVHAMAASAHEPTRLPEFLARRGRRPPE
jgi:DNA polymerase-3 subunit epsilon